MNLRGRVIPSSSLGKIPAVRKLLLRILLSVAVSVLASTALALEVPRLEGRINDLAHLLSPTNVQRLNERLIEYEHKTGHQLAVLTVPSLEGDAIEDFGIRVVESWKLGNKGKDDGVLVLVAARDRKMRIEVGYGLEGDLPDAVASRIVRDLMAPRFRAGDFDGGISSAVEAIIRKTGGAADSTTSVEAPVAVKKPTGWIARATEVLLRFVFFGFFGLALLVFVLMNRFGGPRGGIFLGGGGFGRGSSNGFGTGGFGGNGGSFGGGGASGSW